MKKRILMIGVSMLLCVFAGCLEATPLTDVEMDAVADYAASLLLKYDTNYKTPLYYAEDWAAIFSPTPIPEEENKYPSAVGPEVDPSGQKTTKQLTDFFDEEYITVTCDSYELMKSVQSTEYFSLVAKPGRQYAVVKFTLHNNSDKKQVFDASEDNLEYSLDVNTKNVSRVSLSMLENDLQYMKIPVPAKGTADAVLVFEIEDKVPETIHLIIENDREDAIFIKLK